MSSTTLPTAKDHGIRRILINCTHSEELRVATVSGQRLDDIDIEHINKEQKKSNIYLATISRIEPSLEAVFVNYGSNKHGFLPLKEIEKSYFLQSTNDPRQDFRRILREGQEILIQVEKEERGNKGAALTTYITLAGCFLVLMINNPNAGGISRRIEGDERSEMRDVLNSLAIPEGMSVIIRTAGLGKQASDLQWDLDVLLEHWQTIKSKVSTLKAPCLLHQESNVIIRAIRDNLRPNIKEILIDNETLYHQAKEYVELLRKDSKNIVKLYNGDMPIFTKFHIESQIEEAYQHEIRLPSGGSLVFDRTEALTAIDINSAQSTKGQDIENTAFNTNLEAAEEIARQLRLRDVGGLIVIDFIDMSSIKHQREVENRLREALQNDRARIQISRISRFGLLEMSRQRLKSSLGDNTQITCSKCSGTGTVRTIESLALSLIRLIQEESIKPQTRGVVAQLPLELCAFLSNEKRTNIIEIEENAKVKIVLIPNQHYIFPDYKITRIKTTDSASDERSYAIKEIPENNSNDYIVNNMQNKRPVETGISAHTSLLQSNKNALNKPNLLKRLWSSLFSQSPETTQQTHKPQHQHKHQIEHKPKQRAFEHQERHTNPAEHRQNKKNQNPRDTRDTHQNHKKNKNNINKNIEAPNRNIDRNIDRDIDNNIDKKQNNRTNRQDRQDRPNYKNTTSNNKHPEQNRPHALSEVNQIKQNSNENIDVIKNQDKINTINQPLSPEATEWNVFDTIKESQIEQDASSNQSNQDNQIINISVIPVTPPRKRKTDLVKITQASAMQKRSFTAKKKLKYEISTTQQNTSINEENKAQSYVNNLEYAEEKSSTNNNQSPKYINNTEQTDHNEH